MVKTDNLKRHGFVKIGTNRLAVDYELDVFKRASVPSIVGHIYAGAKSLKSLKNSGHTMLTLSDGRMLQIEITRYPVGSGSCMFKAANPRVENS